MKPTQLMLTMPIMKFPRQLLGTGTSSRCFLPFGTFLYCLSSRGRLRRSPSYSREVEERQRTKPSSCRFRVFQLIFLDRLFRFLLGMLPERSTLQLYLSNEGNGGRRRCVSKRNAAFIKISANASAQPCMTAPSTTRNKSVTTRNANERQKEE